MWIDVRGVRWYLPPAGSGADGGTPWVRLILDRGYAHQPLTQIGVLDAAARALRTTLSTPRPWQGSGRGARVEVVPRLTHTRVTLVGPEPVLVGALSELAELLAASEPDLDPDLPSRTAAHGSGGARHPFDGWALELDHWFGPGAAVLDATGVSFEPDVAAVRTFLGSMAPGPDTVTVGATNLPALIEHGPVDPSSPAGGVDPAAASPPLRWRRAGRAGVLASREANLASFRGGLDVADDIALASLADEVTRHLARRDVGGAAVFGSESIDGARLVNITLERAFAARLDRRAALRAITEAVRDIDAGESQLPEMIARYHHGIASRGEDRGGVERLLIRAHALGGRPEPDEPAQMVGTHDVRAALTTLTHNLVLSLSEHDEEPSDVPARPRPKGSISSPDRYEIVPEFAKRLPVEHPQMVVHGTVLGPRLDGTTVDLSRLVAVVEHGETADLVDLDGDRVRIVWASMELGRLLRAQVLSFLPAEAVLTAPPDRDFETTVRRAIRPYRVRRILMAAASAAVVLAALAASWVTR